MVYGATGTHDRYDRERHGPIVRARLERCGDGEEFVSGAAFGLDTAFCLTALELYPDARHVVIVPARWHNDELVKTIARKPNVTLIPMPAGSTYRDRNEAMVERLGVQPAPASAGDIGFGPVGTLLAFPYRALTHGRAGGGTGMTVNIAERAGVPVDVTVLP